MMAAGIGRNHFRGITRMVAGTNTANKERKIHMKYEIYQLKEDTMDQAKLRFMASDQAAQLGGIHRENYRLVYEGNVETRKDAQQTLDGLFRRFNIDRPTGFEGHSLSVSDIIYLADGESSGWWFCDAYGWKLLSGEEWGQT